jgi:hypothetical protein
MRLHNKLDKPQDSSPSLETPQIDSGVERNEAARVTRRSERSMKIKSGVKGGRAIMVCD